MKKKACHMKNKIKYRFFKIIIKNALVSGWKVKFN